MKLQSVLLLALLAAAGSRAEPSRGRGWGEIAVSVTAQVVDHRENARNRIGLDTVQVLMLAALAAAPARLAIEEGARETTAGARKLVLERIDTIARTGQCRQAFGQEKIDLDRVRLTVHQLRFYNAEGPEGHLRFSEVVGLPASPDQPLRELARGLFADAFVLGYQEGRKYIRTKHVVLSRGYLWQTNPQDGTLRPTTEEEKQALLLHEVLHVALDVDDDDLTRRELCPLRLLAFCPRTPPPAAPAAE